MIGPVFVDTNPLIYSRDPSNRTKQEVAATWLQYLWGNQLGRTSTQVLIEYYQNVTRKLRPGRTPELARADVRTLLRWDPVIVGAQIFPAAWEIEDRYRISWWDALIVAAAQAQGCRYLLTEDLQHGQQMGPLTIVDPFRSSPRDFD